MLDFLISEILGFLVRTALYFRTEGVKTQTTYNEREPKTRLQKVQLYYEDNPLCPSRYIIYLWKTSYKLSLSRIALILICSTCRRTGG